MPNDIDFDTLGLPDLRPTRGREVGLTRLTDLLVPGMHLAINSGLWPHWHHGIYVGKSKETRYIVDMWGTSKKDAQIRQRPLDDFLKGAVQICIVEYDDDSLQLKNAATSRAIAALKADRWMPLYDAFANNYECFAFGAAPAGTTSRLIPSFLVTSSRPRPV